MFSEVSSFSKHSYTFFSSLQAVKPLLANNCGVDEGLINLTSSRSRGWWGLLRLRLGVVYMVDMLAAMNSDQSGAPSRRRCAAVSSTSFGRVLQEILAPLMLHLTVKWLLPDSGKLIGDGVSISLERIKGSIAFHFQF
jgi:hypothetical protein